MVTKFKEWWHRPIQKKDRILAAVIGGIGGFWIGVLGRISFGSMPVAITTLGYWAIGAIVIGVILGVLFPKPITVVLFPFSIFGIGGS